jgi:hypothetical protein
MCNIGNTHTHDRRADWLDMPNMQPSFGGFLMSLETVDFMIAMSKIHAELARIANVLEMMERRT